MRSTIPRSSQNVIHCTDSRITVPDDTYGRHSSLLFTVDSCANRSRPDELRIAFATINAMHFKLLLAT